jgi:acyl-coenzyme A synthetase/AMP-(fatty) acid ligase
LVDGWKYLPISSSQLPGARKVLKVAGHRIGTAELEDAAISHPAVVEAGVAGKPDPVKGRQASMDNKRIFTDRELQEMGARTLDLVLEAIDAGNKEKAKELAKRMKQT